MNSSTDNQIIMTLLNLGNLDTDQINSNFEQIKQIIGDKLETTTGSKLFNKEHIIKEIQTSVEANEEKLISASTESITKNLVSQITFNAMFKSNLDFTLVFKDDEIIILYKNKKVEIKNLDEVKADLITNKLNHLPVITELYVNNIIGVIEKMINKDLSVKYHLIDIPTPYWNLYEIKCKKSNPNAVKNLEKYKHLDNVISGKLYEPTNNSSSTVQIMGQNEETDPELKAILMQIEEFEKKEAMDKNFKVTKNSLNSKEKKDQDNHYRMEIMSYLNDNEIIYFLEKMEQLDKIETTLQSTVNKDITNYIKVILDSIGSSPNKMIRYYLVNKMFNFIMQIKQFLETNQNFRVIVYKKINELQDDLYIIQTAGLQFSKEITSTFEDCKKFIDDIEKSFNPDYVPKWNDSQINILNQINNTNNNDINYNINYNKSNYIHYKDINKTKFSTEEDYIENSDSDENMDEE
jgi:hypothetical protein